ncbi:MAG: hypothetical protein ACYC8T_38345 [Myxococcaceae bacterium]
MPSTPIRDFVHALAAGGDGPKTLPSEFLGIARGLLHHRHGADDQAQDLVASFLVRLVEATRRKTAGSAEHLTHLGEPELRGVVRHRIRQVLAEQSPARRVVKQLRDSVRLALARGLPPPPPAAPTTLIANEKLCGPTVASITAWVLAQEDAPAVTDVAGIADRLKEMYFGKESLVPAANEAHVDFDCVDAQRLAAQLHADLAPELLAVLRGRLQDQPLAAIAKQAGVAISSAHARVAKAVEAVRTVVRAADVGRDTGEAALGFLAA